MIGDPDISGLNGKSLLFSITARKSALYLAVHRKVPPSARKSAFSMTVIGTKHAEQPLAVLAQLALRNRSAYLPAAMPCTTQRS